MVHGRFARRVGVDLGGRHVQPVDGPDVDDAGRISRARGLFQHRPQKLDQVEDGLQVHLQHRVPARVVEVVQRRRVQGARVVHQQMQPIDLPGELLRQPAAVILRREIGGQRKTVAQQRKPGGRLLGGRHVA
jgi:hypothetical protein